MTQTDKDFERNVGQMLRDQPLDDDITARLNKARKEAIAQVPLKNRSRWVPFAVAATVAGAALATAFWVNQSAPGEAMDELMAANDDMEILLVEDEFELLEDMEFFQWLSVATDEG